MRADTEWPKDELAERCMAAALNLAAKQIGETGGYPNYVAGLPSWTKALDSICDRFEYVPPNRMMDLCAATRMIEDFGRLENSEETG